MDTLIMILAWPVTFAVTSTKAEYGIGCWALGVIFGVALGYFRRTSTPGASEGS